MFDARRPTRDVDLAATTAPAIRDDELYGGARVAIHGMRSTAITQFNVDINVGDQLWPAPDDIASLA